MSCNRWRGVVCVVSMSIGCWFGMEHAWCAPSAFTYQGRFNDNGNPAGGIYDMQFKIWDTQTSGAGNLYGTNVRPNVVVTAGIFTVELDFSTIFSIGEFGAGTVPPLYLEIGVRPAGSGNPYTLLAPRQAITASPYAIESFNAANLGSPGGVSTFTVQAAAPGPYPSLGFNTDTFNYLAGVQGYGGLFQYGLNDGTLSYFNGSFTPAATQHVMQRALSVDRFGNLYVGEPTSPNPPVFPTLWVNGNNNTTAIFGDGAATGVRGYGGTSHGVWGKTATSSFEIAGVYGQGNYAGVLGKDMGLGIGVKGAGMTGVFGEGHTGVFGRVVVSSNGSGVSGESHTVSQFDGGVLGQNTGAGGIGVVGIGQTGTATGVFGKSLDPTGYGVYAKVAGATTGWSLLAEGPRAAFLGGSVYITGPLTKPAGSFKIDHPLDPANKYLSHSFVESPDMKNIYDGNVVTDAQGISEVTLPDWFEALNRDFRYQLTVIGTFAQAIVAEKIRGNRFVIATSAPNVEVSWMVTGIRRDAYAQRYPIPVEEDKPMQERGTYLHPEVFGQPPELALAHRLKPEAMRTEASVSRHFLPDSASRR